MGLRMGSRDRPSAAWEVATTSTARRAQCRASSVLRPRMKPKPGFHTVAVLDELGLSSAQVARLMRDGHVIDTSASAAKL